MSRRLKQRLCQTQRARLRRPPPLLGTRFDGRWRQLLGLARRSSPARLSRVYLVGALRASTALVFSQTKGEAPTMACQLGSRVGSLTARWCQPRDRSSAIVRRLVGHDSTALAAARLPRVPCRRPSCFDFKNKTGHDK